MELQDVLKGRKERLNQMRRERRQQADQVLITCPNCQGQFSELVLRRRRRICPDCGRYLFMPPMERIAMLADKGSFRPYFMELETGDPLSFPEYVNKLMKNRGKLDQSDAIVAGTCRINDRKVAIGVLDTRFFMGSMGTVVGEVITRLAEHAKKHKLPLILFSASGGARMQEGIYSLMQMAKTAAAIERFKEEGGLYISILCNPTTGGVSASFAFLGDIILAEPKALIGFAGPRVIEQTIGQKLPEGFQSAEFSQENGMVDAIVKRSAQKAYISKLLELHEKAKPAGEYKRHQLLETQMLLDLTLDQIKMESEKGLSAYQKVLKAREKDRPQITDFIEKLFPDFVELKGDRLGAEDGAILGGIATFHGIPVTVIGHRKGKTLEEHTRYHFGMASPEGYRKSLRLMEQAEKFGRPIITFVDTPGAYPGMEAEEHGQSVAIAENLAKFSRVSVPVISIVTGEGGSGGALALAVADQVYMLENAVYSILSPEGFAAILWKDAKRAAEASEVMKLTAQDLYQGGIITGILPEGDRIYEKMDEVLEFNLYNLMHMDQKELLAKRYQRFRKIGRMEGDKAEE